MVRATRTAWLVPAIVMLAAACSSAAPATPAAPASGAPSAAPKSLVISIPREPTFIAALTPLPAAQATDFYQRMFNAFFEYNDDRGQSQPYLAEALPTLNTDTWQIFPDGTMETRYHLKPNLIWHDGTPLTAADFVFSFNVAKPGNGFRTAVVPYTLIDDVTASDDRSVTIHWKTLYPDAQGLIRDTRFGIVPLPRHILEEPFNQGLEAFQGSPYWSHEFIGAGPHKLEHWEIGSYIDAVAFDQHVLGRPKIDRIRLIFIEDQNTAFANMLSGTTQVALDSIGFSQMLQLQQQWAPTNGGTAGITVSSQAAALIQHRPEYADPPAILDVRVRQALAAALDKETFAETVWAGKLGVLDTIFSPTADYYPQIDRAITKYPYDPRVSERLMNDAGYTRGADGFFAGPDGKLTFSVQGPQTRPELPVLGDNWRTAGFDVPQKGLSNTESVDPQVRSVFPALYINASSILESQQMALYSPGEVTTAENHWRGENYSGWNNPDFGRLVDAFNVTFDADERTQQRAQMAKMLTEDVASIPLTYNPNLYAYVATVQNVTPVQMMTTGRITWNIYLWDVAS